MKLRQYDVEYKDMQMQMKGVHELNLNWMETESVIGNIARISCDDFHQHLRSEVCLSLWCFDDHDNCLGYFEVGHGTINMIYSSFREIAMRAMLVGATRLVCVYNHVNGVTTPSTQELLNFTKLERACLSMGMFLNDSLVVGTSGFYSMRNDCFYKRVDI